MSTFPSVISSFSNPQPTDRLNNPSHSGVEIAQNSNLTAIETFIGVEGASSTVGTLIYDIRSPGSNGGGHVQSANKGGTGQTSFNKGDMLVATSSSVMSKLAVGFDSQVIVADSTQAAGIKWGNPNINVQSFLSGSVSFVWNKPSIASRVFVELWGAGGSGGGASGGNKPGGGGGGAYNNGWFMASTLGITETVTIGIGGVGVLGTDSGGQAQGNDGTATVFGATSSLLTAFPGIGGIVSGAGAGSLGGRGGGMTGASQPVSPITGTGTITSSVATTALYSGGGGGDGANGGDTLYGGAGGGGARASTLGVGGVSKFGGVGGAASQTTNATAGAVPGGGGGAIIGTQMSGPGGNGKAIITTFG